MFLEDIVEEGDRVQIITSSGIYTGNLIKWTSQSIMLKTRNGTVYLNPLTANIEAIYVQNNNKKKNKKREVK